MDVIKYEHLGLDLPAVESSSLRGCSVLAFPVAVLCRELAAPSALPLPINVSLLLEESFAHLGWEDRVEMDLCGLH